MYFAIRSISSFAKTERKRSTMKVLVLSITAGGGHNSTGKAICDHLEKMGAQVQMLDTLYYLNKLLGDTVSKGYLLSVENLKHAYKTIYGQCEKRKSGKKLSATRLTNILLSRKLRKYIDDYNPDVIVCTHIFAANIIDVLKVRKHIRAKTIGIVTDFAFHPYWEDSVHFDYIITASEQMLAQARRKGYRAEQVLPFGIPIHPKFSQKESRETVRESLKLDTAMPTLLMMSGSMGYGDLESEVRTLDALETPFQMLIVCGNNAEAKKKIESIPLKKKAVIFGFTDRVDQLMDAADCIVTKPGGLTTSEALAKGLPMIVVNPIPGQEDRNVEFLLNNGAAMCVNDLYSVADLVEILFSDAEKLEAMRRSVSVIGKPGSTERLCEFIMKLPLLSAQATE